MGIFSGRKKANEPAPSAAAPSYTEPNADEITWMSGHLQVAAGLNVDLDDAEQIASFYDLMFQNWAGSPQGSRVDPNDLINILGTVFGEHLVRRTTARWVVATDSSGTELAVHHAATDLLVYPANAVAKRWVANESGAFIRAMADEVARRVEGATPR